ncbi:MAG: hypothetical protein ACFE85_19860 [Candidatus Hodarchaeota archaeon]
MDNISNYKPKNKIEIRRLPANSTQYIIIKSPLSKSDVKIKHKNAPKNINLKPDRPNKRQKLYNNGRVKECGRCHQIKPHEDYVTRMMRGKKTLRSICNECKIQTEQIYRFKNKMKVVQNIYNRKSKVKCQNCDTGIERLPTLECHHPNPELKNKKNINFNRNWVKTKQQLEKEKVMILCVNCHSKKISHIYNNYKKLIQGKNLGPNTSNKEIKQSVKSHVSDPKHHNRIVQLIKKNEIIRQLFGGKCIACGKISTEDSLPALHFHHRDGKNVHPGSETFNAIKNKEINPMKKQLKEENCIVICGNCHKMERTFHFKNYYDKVIPPEYWNQIKLDYETIEENKKNFKFKPD